MGKMHGVLILCLVALSQSSYVPEKPHFFDPIISEVNSAGSSWKAGHNFAPSVSKDVLKRLCGAKFNEKNVKAAPMITEDFYSDFVAASDIPDTFDARTHWKNCKHIGHIRDQGNCGSCWAVSLVSVLTDRFCIATKGIFKYMLSSDDLLTCCNECGGGCGGACPCGAWWHLTKHGIVTGGDHGTSHGCKPYSLEPCDHHVNSTLPLCTSLPKQDSTPSCHSACSNRKHRRNYWRDAHKVKDYYHVNATEDAIQREIITHGPVQAAFTVYEDFYTYKSGVYQYVNGAKVGSHAVKIIGWGVENLVPYWLVVNSWNEHWGDSGVFKIRRGSNECSIENMIFAGVPDLTNYYYNKNELY